MPGRYGVPPAQAMTSLAPAPALPTGIEGTPQQREADQFLSIVRTELHRWKAFLHTWRGELPGGPAFAASRAFERGMGGHLDPSTGEPAPESDGPLRTYLRRQVGPEGLQSLQQMVSFDGAERGRGLAEVFGVPVLRVTHTYRLVVQTVNVRGGASRGSHIGGTVGGEAGVTGGVSVRQFAVVYSNNVGMNYRHSMTGVNASVGVGAGFGTGSEPNGGTDVGGTAEAELSDSESSPATPGYFWAPEWFDGSYVVANLQAGGEVTLGIGRALGGGWSASAGSVTRITFLHDSQSINFDFVSGPSASSTRNAGREVRPRVAVSAGIDAGVGHAFGGQTHGTVRPLPPPALHRPVKTDQMVPLVADWIDFETGSAAVSPDGEAALVALALAVRTYAARFPDADFYTTLVADASPRWEGAPTDADANRRNEQLASERARAAQDRLRTAVEQVMGPFPDHGQYRDLVVVHMRGSQQARIHDGAPMSDNSQRYRRVHVKIEASLYREGEP